MKQQLKNAAVTSIAVCLLISQPVLAAGKPFKKFTVASFNEEEPAKKAGTKTAKAKAAFVSLNNAAVKIYPDVVKRDMHVIAKDNDGKDIEFFVFDLQGTLLQNYKMKARDHNRITGLQRGTYIYRVFSGDEETAAGKFDIR